MRSVVFLIPRCAGDVKEGHPPAFNVFTLAIQLRATRKCSLADFPVKTLILGMNVFAYVAYARTMPVARIRVKRTMKF